jgi:hypothetical protein
MNDRPSPRLERRQSIRITPKGTVILSSGGHIQRGRIANLGRRGMLVATTVTLPNRLLGRAVELQLRLDGQAAAWIRASGKILRIVSDGVAIHFENIPGSLERAIDELSMAVRAHTRVLSAVLVDADPDRRTAIAEGFRAAGCRIVETSTPLEAIVRLGESSFEPDLIAIADSAPPGVADDLRRFVERNHPRAKLVTIGDELDEPTGSRHWISSADPGADLKARVGMILGRPVR